MQEAAIDEGDSEKLTTLLADTDPNALGEDGAAPIHNAVAAGHADVTQILAQYNTDYDAQAHVLAWGLRRHARRCRRKKLAVDAVAEAARNDEL